MIEPTAPQAKAKAHFHANFERNPLTGDPSSLSDTEIRRLSHSTAVHRWLKDDEFREWFFDPHSNTALIESGVQTGIQCAIDILNRPIDGQPGSPRASDHLKALTILLDYGGYGPKNATAKEKPKDDLENLTAEELERKVAQLSKQVGLTVAE
jgi:hypothetical protein